MCIFPGSTAKSGSELLQIDTNNFVSHNLVYAELQELQLTIHCVLGVRVALMRKSSRELENERDEAESERERDVDVSSESLCIFLGSTAKSGDELLQIDNNNFVSHNLVCAELQELILCFTTTTKVVRFITSTKQKARERDVDGEKDSA